MKKVVLNLKEREKIYQTAIISSILILFAIMLFSILSAGAIILVAKKTAIGLYMSKIGMRFVIFMGSISILGIVLLFVPYARLQKYARNIKVWNYESYIAPICEKYMANKRYYVEYNDNECIKKIKINKNTYLNSKESILIIDMQGKRYAYSNS